MRIFPHVKPALRFAVKAADLQLRIGSRLRCYDIYDGDNLKGFAAQSGGIDVILVAPPMADREGALLHPGIQILQTILRNRGISCEIVNYNLPVKHPADPFEHLSRAITELGVKVLGVSLYSQAIKATMRSLSRLKARHRELVVVLGGPHPTEAHLSLLGLRFIDYVVRSEAETSFPVLLEAIISGRRPQHGSIPGVYSYDRIGGRTHGAPSDFVDLHELDRQGLMRFRLRPSETAQYRRFRGAHGLVGPRYWPTSLVRGCPYACTYCAAKLMSGKRLRYREVEAVVDELAHYRTVYGQRHFSFVDDAFTQDYSYVRALCEAICARGLDIEWTTDNGIRYESLGHGRMVQRFLNESGIGDMSALVNLMFDAGWRGTSVGIESGAMRVRSDLVRKGGKLLGNDEIFESLATLKQLAKRRAIDFYINGYLMVGFPPLVLPNGKRVAGETAEEARETYAFVMRLRAAGALDFVNLSIVIPLPGTDMWDHLSIAQRMQILIANVPLDHPERPALEAIVRDVLAAYPAADETCYDDFPELVFWERVYRLSDDLQIEINGAYDAFNADAAYRITLDRPDGQALFALRQQLLEDFYGGVVNELKLVRHVVRRSENLHDFLTYFSYFCRTYLPETKRIRGKAGVPPAATTLASAAQVRSNRRAQRRAPVPLRPNGLRRSVSGPRLEAGRPHRDP